MKRFLMVSSMVLLAHVHGVLSCEETLQELLQKKGIATEELAPALRIACAENNRHEAIRSAIALRDYTVLSLLITYGGVFSSDEELKFIAMAAAEEGYQLFWGEGLKGLCVGPGFRSAEWLGAECRTLNDVKFCVPALVAALKNGHSALARTLFFKRHLFWAILLVVQDVLQTEQLDCSDKQVLILFLSAVEEDMLEEVEQREDRDATYTSVVGNMTHDYSTMLSRVVHIPALHAQLKHLLVDIYIRAADSIYTTDQHGIRCDAMAKVRSALEAVFQHVEIRDVMGVICEFLDSENGRLLLRGIEA